MITEFGTDNYYSCDTFNEMVPNSGDEQFLRNVSRAIFKSMTFVDPKAICNFERTALGVLCRFGRAIPNAVAAVRELKSLGKKLLVVSNSTLYTPGEYLKKLHDLGFRNVFKKEDIFFPTLCIISVLKHEKFKKKIFVVGPKAMKIMLSDAGYAVKCLEGPIEVSESIADIDKYMRDDTQIGAVIVDFDVNVCYASLTKCLQYLKRPEVQLIFGSTEPFLFYREDGFLIGPQNFQNIIQYMSNRDPLICAKPSKIMAVGLISHIRYGDPSRVLFIGDTIDHDIEFARISGFRSLFVQTGAQKFEDLHPGHYPDYVLNTIGEFVKLIDIAEGNLRPENLPGYKDQVEIPQVDPATEK